MFWPLILPFKITFWAFVVQVVLLTLIAPAFRWRRDSMFVVASLLAFVAFIPSCTVVMHVVNAQRFGLFHYDSFADVQDFRIERFLPKKARDIGLYKNTDGNGYRAKYSISENDLKEYLDDLWSHYGDDAAIAEKRNAMGFGKPVSPRDCILVFKKNFEELGWSQFESAVKYHSVGGGSRYYLDAANGVVYQDAYYW